MAACLQHSRLAGGIVGDARRKAARASNAALALRGVNLPEVSTGPGFVATRQVRPYHFEGNRMTLSDTVEDESDVVSWRIVWEKVI